MVARSVLQIEDEESDVLLLRHAFHKAGVRPPQVASNGQEALDYLAGAGSYADRSAFPLPDVVLLDLNMPGASGFEVLAWMRQQSRFKYTPVVVLTSSVFDHDMVRAYELGANSYVLKVSDNQKRLELAHSIKSWWLHYNQLPDPC